MYGPRLDGATLVGGYGIGPNRGEVYRCADPSEQEGMIKYRYVLMIVPAFESSPIMYVASEINETSPHTGSHFLGVFVDDCHENHGASDDWGVYDVFVGRAIEIAAERLKVAAGDIWKIGH